MIEEVRRQFREIPGLREGEPGVKPDSARCVAISTKASLREMIIPGALAIVVPLVIGFIDVDALGGFLAGALVTGFCLAIFMANAGGAWDNAKKYIEAGAHGGKGSDPHKAAVVGDTVGDPFKDTSGPSMNILIKVMTIVELGLRQRLRVIEAAWDEARTSDSIAVRAEFLVDEVDRGALVVDIRPVEQRRQDGDLGGAVVIDRNVIEWRLTPSSPWRIPELAGPDHRVVIVCNEGFASTLAALALRDLGLVRATDLEDGYQALLAGSGHELVDGRPVVDRSVWSDSWLSP